MGLRCTIFIVFGLFPSVSDILFLQNFYFGFEYVAEDCVSLTLSELKGYEILVFKALKKIYIKLFIYLHADETAQRLVTK